MHDAWRRIWREEARETDEGGAENYILDWPGGDTDECINAATGEPVPDVPDWDDEEFEDTDDPQVKIAPNGRTIYQIKFPSGSTGR